MEDSVSQVILSKEISRSSSLCFKNDILAFSTLLGEIILIKLLCDSININGEVIQLVELRFSLTDGRMTEDAASELLKIETMHVGLVRCMAIWNTVREEIPLTDSLRGSIGVLYTKSGNIEIYARKPRKENQK